MLGNIGVKTLSSIMIFIAYQVNQRHAFLKWLITVKDEEVTSHENINNCLVTVTTLLCVFSVMEVAAYFIYAKLVRDEMMQSFMYVSFCN